MAGRVPARLSASEGRKFGLTVGVAFGVLAGIGALRDARAATLIFGPLAAVLILAGLFVPTRLGPVERAWMKFAHLLSRVTTPVFLGIVYFLLFVPTGFMRRIFGKNAIVHSDSEPGRVAGGYWIERAPGKRAGDLRRQF